MVDRVVLSCLLLGFLMGVMMLVLPKLVPAKVIPGCEFSYDFSTEEHTNAEHLIELWPKREACADDAAFTEFYRNLARARCEEFFDADS
ncbi:MAG: hypothetical protein KAJ19_08965, partial [Gammaproteobacteria bacterium]|nr:hypothetical protein [Gammaproteobacteria bacterium]